MTVIADSKMLCGGDTAHSNVNFWSFAGEGVTELVTIIHSHCFTATLILAATYTVCTFDSRLEGVAFPLVHIPTERARVGDVIRGIRDAQDTLKLSWKEWTSWHKHYGNRKTLATFFSKQLAITILVYHKHTIVDTPHKTHPWNKDSLFILCCPQGVYNREAPLLLQRVQYLSFQRGPSFLRGSYHRGSRIWCVSLHRSQVRWQSGDWTGHQRYGRCGPSWMPWPCHASSPKC